MWTNDLDLLMDRELVVVRWRDPKVRSAHGLQAALERHYYEIGAPLFFAAVVGPDCPPPDSETREAMLRGHDRIYEYCRTIRMVFNGTNFRQTVMRSVITAMTLAAGLRGKAFTVDKTIRDTIKVAEQTLGRDADEILTKLLAANIARTDELDS